MSFVWLFSVDFWPNGIAQPAQAHWKWKWKSLSRVRLFATPWAIQSTEFSRTEYHNGWPFPSPGDLLNPEIKPGSPTRQADSLPAETEGNVFEPQEMYSNSSEKENTGVGSLCLLQGIFPTQGSNPHLLHCKRIPHQLTHQGSPRRLEWVAYPFSRGSSQPRNRTSVSCTAGRFFTSWATREASLGLN